MANSIPVVARQTLIDIALQKCGTAESIFKVAAANGMQITDALVAGQEVIYTDVDVFDVADYFRKYQLFPASVSTAGADLLQDQGIDFWKIEFDFKVS